ncbi:unnamed protein product [Phytophthora lilii]|uniref:Unnamed protein product n=1 Tax=Phytophthora lilii TaxID=2077276 RepID=A0A9W6X5H5_9STRA|nr:unnamed protein product [Phytophthora lilii]
MDNIQDYYDGLQRADTQAQVYVGAEASGHQGDPKSDDTTSDDSDGIYAGDLIDPHCSLETKFLLKSCCLSDVSRT